MTLQSNPGQTHVQRVANDITARLAQLVKDPPDLTSYLRAHADCVARALQPVGLSYEMVNGSNLQRVLASNLESLAYRASPEQEFAFHKAACVAIAKNQIVTIEPNVLPAAGLHGLQPEDSPAPDELPVFNRTPFQQIFVPIPVGGASVGVLHIWFTPSDTAGTQIRQVLLRHACGEVELYLKARRLTDVSQELTRLNTYAHLLQELAGDLDLESVTWNIVNYARESLSCERVCLFVATDYGRASIASSPAVRFDYEYALSACSGLKKPHPRSEHAVILQRMARKLTEMALTRSAAPSPRPAVQPGPGRESSETPSHVNGSPTLLSKPAGESRSAATDVSDNAPGTNPSLPAEKAAERPGKQAPARPQLQLTLVQRDPSKTSSRPPEVNEYFEVLPMNWATVLPLFDRENGVCGILLFEGNKPPEKLENSFLQMRDLAVSAGRALGTSLQWTNQRSLRAAQSWISFRKKLLATTPRRWLVNVVLPIAVVAAVLLFPITYHVKGQASILPAVQNTLPVLNPSTLLSVAVQEGQLVRKGEILAVFDTTELQLQLRQAMEEYRRSLVESDAARGLGNEAQMQMSRLSAAKWLAQVEKIENDIRNATIRAPFDGMVLGAQSLANRIGQYLRQGEPVMEIVDPHRWQVKVSMGEQDIIYLQRHLQPNRPTPAELKLAADPTKGYPLQLTDSSQLAYGLDVSTGKYFFGAVLPLHLTDTQNTLFKSGFSGRVSFAVNRRPIAYVMFRDFINFIRYRFL